MKVVLMLREGGCAAKLLCIVVPCLLLYGCGTWLIPLGCKGLYCKAGELLGQALSHKLSLAVVKCRPNWSGRIQHVNEEELLSTPLSGLAFCYGHLRQVHFEIES